MSDLSKSRLMLFLLFICGITFAYSLLDLIQFPFYDRWNVTGINVVNEYNPFNNTARFLLLILTPSLFLFISYQLGKIKPLLQINKPASTFTETKDHSRIRIIFFVLILIFTALLALITDTYHASGIFDPFHEGETLGTAVCYMKGKKLYDELIFIHGGIQDPLRSVLAFELFGQSIGASRTMESILKIISFILLTFFVFRLYSGHILKVGLFLLVLFCLLNNSELSAGNFVLSNFILIPTRDIVTFLFLIILTFLHDIIISKTRSRIAFYIVFFFFSFIPVFSFIYSVDRGYFIFFSYVILLPLIYIFFIHKTNVAVHFFLSSIIGVIVSSAIILYLLEGDAREFIHYITQIMPRYKDLLDGHPYPFHVKQFGFVCILVSFNVFHVLYSFFRSVNPNMSLINNIRFFILNNFLILSLLLLSLFFFRGALGRSDWEHVSYSSILTYILLYHICVNSLTPKLISRKIANKAIISVVVFVCVFMSVYIIAKDRLTENFPCAKSDSLFIPENYMRTIAYLKSTLKKDELFFTLTSEASWYYFLSRPSPTRFPVVWFAAPFFYQQEMINDLKKQNVKYILYKNKSWTNKLDGISNEKRFPILTNYIHSNYQLHETIEDHEIWIRSR